MRLFLGIDLPDNVKENISLVRDKFIGVRGKIKWVPKENLHVTLKFLGDVDENKIENIREKLTTIYFRPFRLRLSGLCFFFN